MQQTLNIENGILKIYDDYSNNAPVFSTINSDYIIYISNLINVEKIKKIKYKTSGETTKRFLSAQYRISYDNLNWSEWYEFNNNVDIYYETISHDILNIEIKFIRKGTNPNGVIKLLEYEVELIIERPVKEEDNNIIIQPNETVIIKPPYIYKVFKITDIEIISYGDINNTVMKYRFSQDNSRTWTEWEYLTKENITTVRINPIRFFQIEYMITNNSNSDIVIYEINLIGEFSNITLDYKKTNLYGIRECCRSNVVNNGVLNNSSCDETTLSNIFNPLTKEDISKLFNPYYQGSALELYNKLSVDAEQIFGHNVIYFLTDPDKNGQDHILNEYQLYNVICQSDMKIMVESNNFPENNIFLNNFDLSLFDTMEVHISKKQFKEKFGVNKRPSKEDFIYFCDLNRMFQVEHAQQFRGFNNAAVYYKLILKKYNKKANIQPETNEIKNNIMELTKNSTIEELFGFEINKDKSAVANKDQHKTLTKDPIRLEYYVEIVKELINNSYNIISKSHYNLSTIKFGDPAVVYKNVPNVLNVSDNLCYIIWFNINNYIINETYNFYNYYDEDKKYGIKINLINDKIIVTLNTNNYDFSFDTTSTAPTVDKIDENIWYAYVLNINQRNRYIEQWIYKRKVDDDEYMEYDINSTDLLKLYYNKTDMVPSEFELENINACILSSDMKITNIRLFNDIIAEEMHNKILNQYIIGDDSKNLIFADNANMKLILPNHPIGNE